MRDPGTIPNADPPPLTRTELRVFAVSMPLAVVGAALPRLLVVRRPVNAGGPWMPFACVVSALAVRFDMVARLLSWTAYGALPFRRAGR